MMLAPPSVPPHVPDVGPLPHLDDPSVRVVLVALGLLLLIFLASLIRNWPGKDQ